MSASTVINTSSTQKTPSEPKKPLWKEKWFGHSVCEVDKLSWLLGCSLLVAGVALFVLNSLYATDYFIAATATSSIGGFVFFLGLIAVCCLRVKVSGTKQNPTGKSSSVSGTGSKTFNQPVPSETATEEFFASKGVFGLPPELIEEINIWRKYRTSENFTLKLDAGFLLHGPPGTGKTTIAKHVAEILGGTYFEKKCGDLKSQYYGESEENISNLFKVPEGEFRIVVIDEISGLLSKRDGHWTDNVKEHFLGTVDGTGENQNYILIGTTNRFERLDDAMVRRGRLGRKFKIEHPTLEAREQIFAYHLNKIELPETEDWSSFAQTLASKTDGRSGAEIVGCISDAQRKALLADRGLTQKDFLDALIE